MSRRVARGGPESLAGILPVTEQGVLNVNSKWKSLKLKVLCIIYTEEALVWTGKR